MNLPNPELLTRFSPATHTLAPIWTYIYIPTSTHMSTVILYTHTSNHIYIYMSTEEFRGESL